MFKKSVVFILLLAVVIFFGLDRLYHPKGMRFKPSKIVTYHHSTEWSLPLLSEEEQKEIDRILNQKFTYFDKGSQSYVFISEDKKHVLKFLKQCKLRPRTWLAYIPLSFNPYRQQKLFFQEKRRRTFDAQKIAFTEFRKETGLLYAHLNRTNNLQKSVELFDKKGRGYTIALDNTSFSIQKKVNLVYPHLSELIKQGNQEKAKKVISSFCSLVDLFAQKGVIDHDPIVRKNFGVLDDEVIQFDIGRMRIGPPQNRADEVANAHKKIERWIAKHHPEFLEALNS